MTKQIQLVTPATEPAYDAITYSQGTLLAAIIESGSKGSRDAQGRLARSLRPWKADALAKLSAVPEIDAADFDSLPVRMKTRRQIRETVQQHDDWLVAAWWATCSEAIPGAAKALEAHGGIAGLRQMLSGD